MEELLIRSLLKPSAYPEPITSVELLQTHVSYLFITDHFVYKVKKPVDFGFLNFTTLDRRRFYCEEEVRLNRRLCPDIYLGVVPVRESGGGATFAGEGKIVDYAVKMRRLPEERMLSRLLEENRVTEADMRKVARTVAEFHLTADQNEEIKAYGGLATITNNWDENFQQVESDAGSTVSTADLAIIRSWVNDFLEQHAVLFAERVAQEFIRDCDGDIHAENICLDNQVCIFDCIEFNTRFRFTDTAADIAFLLMDLDYRQHTPLAAVFLDEYITVTGDRGVMKVLDFYKIYRAFVRGKVESFRMRDESIPRMERESARKKACGYFRLARGYILRQRLERCLIITCGLMGSGKSSIASELAFEMGLDIVSSDQIRKGIAAIPSATRSFVGYDEGIYSSAFTTATYEELLKRSELALCAGRSVIVDATFRREGDRATFRLLAERLHVPFHIIETGCPESLIKERLEARLRTPGEVSDGRWELFHRQKDDFEPLGEHEGRQIFIDTSKSIVDNINRVLEFLGVLHDVA